LTNLAQVWSTLPTAEILAEAAANTVRTPINMQGAAAQAAVATGLDHQLLYDYRCVLCVWILLPRLRVVGLD
jgi:hypothetical protein